MKQLNKMHLRGQITHIRKGTTLGGLKFASINVRTVRAIPDKEQPEICDLGVYLSPINGIKMNPHDLNVGDWVSLQGRIKCNRFVSAIDDQSHFNLNIIATKISRHEDGTEIKPE